MVIRNRIVRGCSNIRCYQFDLYETCGVGASTSSAGCRKPIGHRDQELEWARNHHAQPRPEFADHDDYHGGTAWLKFPARDEA
jgi:hypothetical protein